MPPSTRSLARTTARPPRAGRTPRLAAFDRTAERAGACVFIVVVTACVDIIVVVVVVVVVVVARRVLARRARHHERVVAVASG